MRRRCLCKFCLAGNGIPEYWRNRESNPYLKREWPGYVVGPEMSRYGIREVAPGAAGEDGVYFLFNGDTLAYVGKSVSIASRIAQHRISGRPFTHYGWVCIPGDLTGPMEVAYIHALTPHGNALVEPPVFLQHEEIVEAIQRRWKSVPETPPTPGVEQHVDAEHTGT